MIINNLKITEIYIKYNKTTTISDKIDPLNNTTSDLLNTNNDSLNDMLQTGFDLGFDINNPEDELEKKMNSKIHLHIRKRTTRKSITTIEGLEKHNIEMKKFIKSARKNLSCNGAIVKNKLGEEVITLQGDHREVIADFLQSKYKIDSKDIITHGY